MKTKDTVERLHGKPVEITHVSNGYIVSVYAISYDEGGIWVFRDSDEMYAWLTEHFILRQDRIERNVR